MEDNHNLERSEGTGSGGKAGGNSDEENPCNLPCKSSTKGSVSSV